jgi:hypothetical protein
MSLYQARRRKDRTTTGWYFSAPQMRNKRIPAAARDAPSTRPRPRTQCSGPSPREHCQQARTHHWIRHDACNYVAAGWRQGQAGARGSRRLARLRWAVTWRCRAEGAPREQTPRTRPRGPCTGRKQQRHAALSAVCLCKRRARRGNAAGGRKREGRRRECVVNWQDRPGVRPRWAAANAGPGTAAHARTCATPPKHAIASVSASYAPLFASDQALQLKHCSCDDFALLMLDTNPSKSSGN